MVCLLLRLLMNGKWAWERYCAASAAGGGGAAVLVVLQCKCDLGEMKQVRNREKNDETGEEKRKTWWKRWGKWIKNDLACWTRRLDWLNANSNSGRWCLGFVATGGNYPTPFSRVADGLFVVEVWLGGMLCFFGPSTVWLGEMFCVCWHQKFGLGRCSFCCIRCLAWARLSRQREKETKHEKGGGNG